MLVNILTKNPGKRAAAKKLFDEYKIGVNFIDKDFPEIQAENSLEIAKFTAVSASKELNIPVIREDHSLVINALGIPGPYTSYIEKKLPAGKILKIIADEKDRSGYFEIATVYAEPNGSTKEFVYRVPIEIATEEKGNLQNGWARIIRLKEETRTFAEYPEEKRLDVWNQNYKSIAEWLLSRGS